ncbi:MAG: chromate resistance protein [Burkholderiales bacterium]|nr:chromate resistance protein [Burkholderiales bacterium]
MSDTSQPAGGAPALWLALVAALPRDDAAGRMHVLRTLEGLGCAVMREGVYLLPDTPANRANFRRLADHIARIKGDAWLLPIHLESPTEAKALRTMFDRSGRYSELIKTVEGLKAGFGVSDPTAIAQVLSKQRRELESITSLDFFVSPLKERAERLLTDMEARVRDMMFPEGRAAAGARPATRSKRQYFRRAWATRKPLFADRLASAWLIRRFIDPEATMLWLDKREPCPGTAVGFGFEGATFCNSKARVTYEELLASFGLDKQPSLAKIGALVHALDAGNKQMPEAAGVETLLAGARHRAANEDELLRESERTFDLLYEAYYEVPAKKPEDPKK